MNIPSTRVPDPLDVADGAESDVYRSPHVLAVLTLVVGIVSGLGLISGVFWPLPLVTVVLGVAALRSLAANPEKVGRRAAVIGMVLAVLFGVTAWSYYFSRQARLVGLARQHADTWFQLIQQERLREAHQLHGRKVERAAPGLALDDFYRGQRSAETDFMRFFDEEPLQTVVRVASQARIEFKRLERYLGSAQSESFVLRYDLTYEDTGRQRELPLFVVIRRVRNASTGDYDWHVEAVRATVQGLG